MGHVRRARMDHYAAPAISCNHNENMLQLIAGHMGYPEVLYVDYVDSMWTPDKVHIVYVNSI
jgi:hypothetical protein